MALLWASAVVVCSGVAFVAARATAPSAAPPPAAAVRPTAAPDLESLRRELRQAVRDEVRASLAERTPVEPAAVASLPSAPAPVDPEREEASARAGSRARDLLAATISTRRWDAAAATELRRLRPDLTRADLDDVLGALLPAINRGELAVAEDVDWPPF